MNPSILVTRKNFYFKYVGLAPLTLLNALWNDKILKIYRPANTATATAVQSFIGAFNGASAGGAVSTLEPGKGYHMVAAVYDGSWELPECILVEDALGSATANVIPTASATSPATITLPTSQVQLLGSGTDSDGTIVAYAWRQVTGAPLTGLPATTQNVTAGNITTVGSYQFGFKTQDNSGAWSTEVFVNTTVEPAPVAGIAPVANAGPDTTLPAGTRAFQLSGSATDSDGFVASYQWLQVSGPTATLSSTTVATPNVTVPSWGEYKFRLVAIDNAGNESVPDDVIHTVLSQWDGRPVYIIHDGDSTTQGSGSGRSYPLQLGDAYGPNNIVIKNQGDSGKLSSDLLARAATVIDGKYLPATYFRSIYTLLVGINDIHKQLQTPEQTKANIEAILRGRVAKGFISIAGTILPSSKGFGAVIDDINAHIRANYLSWGCVGIADHAADPELSVVRNAIYSDGTHPTTLGDQYMARVLKAVIDPILKALDVPVPPYVFPVDGGNTGPSGTSLDYDTTLASQIVELVDVVGATTSTDQFGVTYSITDTYGTFPTNNAYSNQIVAPSLPANDKLRGWMSFTVNDNNVAIGRAEFMCGLSDHVTAASSYMDGQYYFHKTSQGVRAYGTATGFSGNEGSLWQPAASGDIFRVQVFRDKASWYRNGEEFFTAVLADNNLPLRAEVMGTNGAIVTGMRIAGVSMSLANAPVTPVEPPVGSMVPVEVIFENLVDATASGNTVNFTGTTATTKAHSKQAIGASTAEDLRGWMEVTISPYNITNTTGEYLINLSANPNAVMSSSDFVYALHKTANGMRGYGAATGLGSGSASGTTWQTCAAGDVFRVEVWKTKAVWKKNGVAFFTNNSKTDDNQPLKVDAVGKNSAQISNVKIAAVVLVP